MDSLSFWPLTATFCFFTSFSQKSILSSCFLSDRESLFLLLFPFACPSAFHVTAATHVMCSHINNLMHNIFPSFRGGAFPVAALSHITDHKEGKLTGTQRVIFFSGTSVLLIEHKKIGNFFISLLINQLNDD